MAVIDKVDESRTKFILEKHTILHFPMLECDKFKYQI